MIDINELRVGNLVYLTPFDNKRVEPKLLTVSGLIVGDENVIGVKESEKAFKPEHLNPVMLYNDVLNLFKPSWTKEVILTVHEKEYRRAYVLNEDTNLNICYVMEDYGGNGRSYYRLRINEDNVSMFLMTKLGYIHQLQNIIYWLTGKEFHDIAEK